MVESKEVVDTNEHTCISMFNDFTFDTMGLGSHVEFMTNMTEEIKGVIVGQVESKLKDIADCVLVLHVLIEASGVLKDEIDSVVLGLQQAKGIKVNPNLMNIISDLYPKILEARKGSNEDGEGGESIDQDSKGSQLSTEKPET